MVEERLIKMGERDDSLPPEYRPTEEDRKVPDVLMFQRRESVQISLPVLIVQICFFKENGRREEKGRSTKGGKNALRQSRRRTLKATG